jgi:carboxypeptidase Q
MRGDLRALTACWLAASAFLLPSSFVAAQADTAGRLVAAMLADTPLASDLAELTDVIGGRPTGSAANLRSVDWAIRKFTDAGLTAKKEAFSMPARWNERSVSATVTGDGIAFSPAIVSMPFSTGTPASGLTAPLLDGGQGADADFARLGDRAKGAFVLVETEELKDIEGLFKEYAETADVEPRAFAKGVAGIVYMGSRPFGLLYRHNASLGPANTHPLVIMEREEAQRALRLVRAGHALTLTEKLDIESGGSYESFNVVAELAGTTKRDEIVVIGAHLDSWGLGTGANDNGCNAAMVIDVARQMTRAGVKPARTIRFALFNGEEQGLLGSWGYVKTHQAELDRHVMASSYDIGSGRINGFFTGGRPDLVAQMNRALAQVAAFGPYTHIDAPIVGTDNFDFMIEGIPNLVGNQDAYNYGPNYHARSDTYDKVDIRQLKMNGAIAAAVTWAFANDLERLPRQSRAEIETLMKTTDLPQQMKMMGVFDDWTAGRRGRKAPPSR